MNVENRICLYVAHADDIITMLICTNRKGEPMEQMNKKEILDILDNAKDKKGSVPMRLVRQAFDKLPTIQPVETDTNVGDTISRQAAIDAIFSEPLYKSGMKKRDVDVVVPAIYKKIKSLPSVQPTATWLIHKWGDDAQCSNCGRSFKDVYDMDNYDQYCRHCGTHMKGIKAI